MENSSQLNKSPLIEQPSGFDTKKYIARKERQAEMRDQRLGVDVGTTASQRILDKAFMNTPLRVNLGMEARPSQGMLGELGTGIARGTFTTVRGVANTLEELTGNDGPGTMSYGMDRWARTHQGTFVGQPAYEGITDWSAGMIGEQVPFMASLLISGGTTGAIAKGMQLGMGAAKTLTTAGAMATVSAIQYGDNVDGIRKAANGKLSESQIHAMGALSTVVQSALEVALGPDAKILDATVMNAVRKSARPAAEMIALTAGGKGLFKSARNYFGSIAAESFTEFSQSITQSIFEDMSAGPGTQMSKEDFAEAFQAALAAVPSSALFGGFGMHAQWRERQKMLDVLKGLENDKSAIDLRAKTEEEKLARQQRTNAAFDTFKGKLSEKFGETGAEAITATVEVAAYHWAVERGLNPEDYINTFGMLFSNTTLSQQQQIELKKIESEEGRIQWMRNNVQGYREFEASEKDGYVADAFGKQFAVELDEYSALFGRGVFEGLLNEIGTAQDESIEANKNRETAPTPQEMTDQAAKRRADAVLNLYNLRQLALDAVADTKMEGDHIKLASLTRQSSSDMFKAIINPGENTSWIKPENMRRTLANLIYINNDNISREDAHATVQKLSTTKREGMKYSELEAYFLYEAGIDEMNNNDGTMFSSDEIVEALRVIKDNEDAWNKVVSQELGEYSYQAMLDAADAAGASAAQKARIVINHARNMRQRSLENAAEIWKMRDASEIKMSEDDAVAVSEFESEARKIDDLISKIEQAILEKANINTILEIANIKTIPRLTEELDRAVTDLFAMNYKIEEGAVRALRATEQEKADSISAAQEARLVINRSLNIPKKSSFLIQELNKLRDNSTTPLSEEETEAISVIESVSSKLSALISETEKAIREDGDAETILSLSAKVKRAESDLSVKNGMFETHIVQVMKDVADKEIRNAADAEGASVVQKALLALNHAFNMSYKGQVKLTSEQAREWKRAKKSTVDLVGKPRKNTKPTVDGRTDVNEINVYTENLLNRISDLSADLRESMQRAENNIEIAKLTDELNEAISELSGYVSVVEEGLASELKQAMGFDPNKQAPLRSEAETKVYAEYNIKKKIAVFYANATAEDVIHEWFHHVDTNNLLPEKLRDAMNEKYGINTDSSSTEIRNAREKAARDFVKYIAHVSGKDMDYPEELEEAFAYLREVFAAGLHAEQGIPLYSDQSGQYKPEVQEFFKGLLDGVTGPDWRQEMMAKIIARSMENDPPQTSEYEPPLQSSNMMNVTDPNSLRNAAHKMNKGGVAKGDGKTTHGKFFEDAYKKITGKDYEQGGWENLSLPNKQLLAQMAVNAYQETHQSYTMEELDAAAQAFNVERFADLDEKTKKQIRNSFESHRRAATSKNLDDVAKTFHMDAIRKAANNALGEFIPEARAIARLNPEIRRRERGERGGEVGWMDSFGSGVSSGYKKFEAWVKAKTFDFDAMIDYLDDGKKDGPVKRLLLDPLRKGVQKWAEARHETDKWLIEAGETHGAMPEVNDWKKEYYFGIEKKKLSVRQALFIYMYTDKGRAKDETKTLFESNKVKLGNDIDSVMTDVIQLVEGWGFGKDKGFVRWVQKKGVNDYRHSLKEREGWTKTYPLRNYARAQMDYMKRIYPELNRVHLERTGRELGNLFKGKDGKTREFIAPSMRMGQSWAHGKGLTDLFVANEEERTALVREVYGKKYGTDVTFDKLSDEEQKAIYALEEDLHVEESGISKRRTNARSQLVGSLESRTKGFTESEILMDAPFIFERYRDQANIYRTKYNIIDYLDAITRHGEFRETIRALVGDDRLDRIHNAIREMITRERFSGGRNYVDDDFDRLVSDVQGRVLPAVLMGRISTQAMQLTSAPRALAELPFRDHLKFFSNSLKIMGQLGTNIGRIGDVISMRHNPFFGDTEVGQWMQHMLESNPEILTRMYDPNVADYYESGQQRTGAGAIKVGRSNLADVALSGLRWMDMAAVLLVYQTCYESKVAELKRSRNKMTDAQIEKAAVDHAAHVVQITQIASTTTDRNLIQTARPTVRMWFPFTGDLMKQFTYINRQIVAPLARGWRDGKFEGVLQAMFVPGNQYGNQPAFKRILYFGLLPMTMVSLIKRRRPPESWEEWREDMLGLSVSTIPLIGPIFQNAITSNYQIDGTPIAMMPVMSLSKALRSLGKDGLIGEDGYVNEYGLEELGRAVLSGNGLPVVFVPFASEFCKMMLGSDAFTPEEKTIIERVLRVLSLSQAPTSAEK